MCQQIDYELVKRIYAPSQYLALDPSPWTKATTSASNHIWIWSFFFSNSGPGLRNLLAMKIGWELTEKTEPVSIYLCRKPLLLFACICLRNISRNTCRYM